MKSRKTPRRPALVRAREAIALKAGGLRFVVVADTHGRPHPSLDQRIIEAAPGHILHAGDIVDLSVLATLRKHGPVTAVRGNIDARAPDLPDAVTIDLRGEGGTLLKTLLVHIAVLGIKSAPTSRASRRQRERRSSSAATRTPPSPRTTGAPSPGSAPRPHWRHVRWTTAPANVV
jgi:hypothetical protein